MSEQKQSDSVICNKCDRSRTVRLEFKTITGGLIGYKFGGSIGASISATLAGAFYTGKTIGEAGVGILNFLEYSRECKTNFIECMDCSK